MTSAGRCPPPEELARAASVGLDEPLRAHLAACGDCGVAWQTQVEMAALGKELDGEPAGAERRQRVRALLLAAPPARSRAWRLPALVAAAAAAAVLFFWLRPAKAPERAASTSATPAEVHGSRPRDPPDEQAPRPRRRDDSDRRHHDRNDDPSEQAPPAEEAIFQQAAASGRAGGPAAREGLQGFLDRYPRSPRAAEASVLLGWLYFDSGDRAEAETRFRAGFQMARSRRVRHSAHEGIEAISGEPDRRHRDRRHR